MECRICFEDDNSEENPLLSPCRCSGTSKYVHLNCIQTWRRTNINTEYLTKCRECNAKYNINKDGVNETFLIDYSIINCFKQNFNYFCFNLFGFIISFFSRSLDRYTGYGSLFLLDSIEDSSKDIANLIKTEEVYSIIFYYSYINFWTAIVFLLLFLGTILIKIRKLGIYFKLAYKWLIPSILSLLHFFYLIISSNNTLWLFEFILNLEIVLSSANLFIFLWIFEKHNKTVKKINDNNIGILENFLNV